MVLVLRENKMNEKELIIYNWLQNAWLINRKAKNKSNKNNFKKYNEKYDIILKAVKAINELESENIVYKWDKAGGSDCIHFYFGDGKSVSFHIPELYAELIKKEKLWNLK